MIYNNMGRALGDLEKIAEEIKTCKKCPLHNNRINAVPGEGNHSCGVMLIGEAPGFNEDLQGRPFVGAAGKLLDELMGDVGVSRGVVYITNVVKCRPPSNRQPRDNEVKVCTSLYLDKQIAIINPKLIVCLGNISSKYIFNKYGLKFKSMSEVHGKMYRIISLHGELKIIATYHPAAILRNPKLIEEAKMDWKTIGEAIRSICKKTLQQ